MVAGYRSRTGFSRGMSPGKIPTFHPQRPHVESNDDPLFRKQVLSPLSHRGKTRLLLGAGGGSRTHLLLFTKQALVLTSIVGMEPPAGVEPATSSVPRMRSPN